MKKTNSVISLCITTLLCLSLSDTAKASLINLFDFFADPTVSITGDGLSASFTEDPFLSSVILSNDPGLGDSNVIVPDVNTSLLFDYSFTKIAGNDEFGAFIVDTLTGFSAGSAFEFFSQDTSSGTVSFDISSLVGNTLGLQFQLSSLIGDADFTSILTVSNVRLVTSTVPEPSTLLLIGSCLIGMFGFSYRRQSIKDKIHDFL